jgi:tetratricopeptide (TPR) repeat protein
MIRMFVRLVLLAAIAVTAAPLRAAAQPAAPSERDVVQAKQYTSDGIAAAKNGDYDTAVASYEKAYDLVPHPTLLFNQAEAHRLAGRLDKAEALYKRYLDAAPTGPLANDARDRLAEIARRNAEQPREVAPVPPPIPPSSPTLTGTPTAPPAGPELTGTAPVIEAPAQPGRRQRIAGIAVAAAGVVAFGVGAGYGLHARDLQHQVEKMYDRDKEQAGERANTIAIVGMTGGGILAIAGAGLYWWGYSQGHASERVAVGPLVSDRTAGFVIAGSWR